MARETSPERQRLLHRTDWMALLSGILFVVLGILLVSGVISDALLLWALLVGGPGVRRGDSHRREVRQALVTDRFIGVRSNHPRY
ncbi:hypothetical protein [Nonomuraea dietziae]|uniref:hypothetical protein n=1 Tax=Nonomuraea dietziae TaxID=65515 RepID=UPI0031D6C4E7